MSRKLVILILFLAAIALAVFLLFPGLLGPAGVGPDRKAAPAGEGGGPVLTAPGNSPAENPTK